MSIDFQDSSVSTRKSADSPYKQLVRRQMSSSSTFIGNFSDTSAYDPNSTISVKLGDINVPNNLMSMALMRSLREFQSSASMASSSSSGVPKSRLVQHPVKKREYVINQDPPEEKNFEKELYKKKITELFDPRESYSVKWSKVVEARNMAKASEDFKRARNNAKVIIFDNMSMNRRNVKQRLAALKDHSSNSAVAEQRALNISRKQELEENLREIHALEIKKRVDYARTAKEEIAKSISIAKSLLEQEKKQKRDLKHPRTVKLNTFTSSKIEIPKEINDHIKNAKRYQEYLDAKEERRRFFEKTMDDRIAAMAQSKVEAQLKSVASGVPISVSAIRGVDFFEMDAPITTTGFSQSRSSSQRPMLDEDMIFMDYDSYLRGSSHIPSTFNEESMGDIMEMSAEFELEKANFRF